MTLKEYAHLKADEKAIAKRWVAQVPIQGRREWDLHLKVVEPKIPAWWTKKDMSLYHSLYDKRIDLTVYASDAIWIMEITPKLSKAAIGGCLAYRDLFLKEFKPSLPVLCGVICEVDDPNYHDIMDKLDIKLWLV